MPTTPIQTTSPASEPSAPAAALHETHARIAELAQSNPSKNTFFARALEVVAKALASPYAAMYVRSDSNVIEHDCHCGETDPAFWKTSLQHFLTDSLSLEAAHAKLFESRKGVGRVAFLSAPLRGDAGEPIGALALVTGQQDHADAGQKLMLLESLACYASYVAQTPKSASSAAGVALSSGSAQAFERAASSSSATELAFAITNGLRNKLNCEQVALGLVKNQGVQIISISGLDEVVKQSSGVTVMRAAMEECLDADQPLVSQGSENWSSESIEKGHRLHLDWRTMAKGDAVASIPLHANGHVAAILSMRRSAIEPFADHHIAKVQERIEPFAPALLLVQDARRSLIRHARDSVRSTWNSLTGPGHIARKISLGVAVLAMLWVCFGTATFELTVPCTLAPAQLRQVAAPLDGMLATVDASEGDQVLTGDILCRLDQRELLQQQKELNAEIEVLDLEKHSAMAQDDPVGAQLALANLKFTEARLEIVKLRLDRCIVRSPIDGVVVTNGLEHRLGSVVTLGEPLVEVAPLKNWLLELAVPERDADDLNAELGGSFATQAKPDLTQPFRIARIQPMTEVRESKNVCVAEADLDSVPSWMRPGMEGMAKIRVGPRRVWWISLHRTIDYLRMAFWL